ncbi:MAG: hypothetical protein HY583_00750, partial [Candidatus Omnitrophica bacterium]|nr:hypothetical protein [Candidatus Omnitrophota bacterium]
RDRREDIWDAKHDGGKWDRLEDIRDRREDVRDRKEDVRDRREDRFDRHENRIDRRGHGGGHKPGVHGGGGPRRGGSRNAGR